LSLSPFTLSPFTIYSFTSSLAAAQTPSAVRGGLNNYGGPSSVVTNQKDLMSAPYKRIVIMHTAIIFGGFLVMNLESPVAGVLFLLVLKLCADVVAHVKEHVAPETGTP
jgi:hypothetical protein